MADETLSSGSTEYIEAAIASPDDVSAGDVSFAFLTAGSAGPPDPGDWVAGEWDTDAGTVVREVAGKYQPCVLARVLVGTGSADLAVGTYDVWVRVDLPPLDIQRNTGTLEIV